MQRKENVVQNRSAHNSFVEVYLFILKFPGIAIEILSDKFSLLAKLFYENLQNMSTVVREIWAECIALMNIC